MLQSRSRCGGRRVASAAGRPGRGVGGGAPGSRRRRRVGGRRDERGDRFAERCPGGAWPLAAVGSQRGRSRRGGRRIGTVSGRAGGGVGGDASSPRCRGRGGDRWDGRGEGFPGWRGCAASSRATVGSCRARSRPARGRRVVAVSGRPAAELSRRARARGGSASSWRRRPECRGPSARAGRAAPRPRPCRECP